MGRFLEEVYNEQDKKELFTKNFKGNNEMAQSALLMLKREFINTKKMFTDKKNGIKPLKGDLVIICKDDPRLGLITEVISDHRVKVKYKNRGIFKEAVFHLRCIGLIFRPATPTHFMATVNNHTTQTNPLLTSPLEKLSSSVSNHQQLTNFSSPSGPSCSWPTPTSLGPAFHSCQQPLAWLAGVPS